MGDAEEGASLEEGDSLEDGDSLLTSSPRVTLSDVLDGLDDSSVDTSRPTPRMGLPSVEVEEIGASLVDGLSDEEMASTLVSDVLETSALSGDTEL